MKRTKAEDDLIIDVQVQQELIHPYEIVFEALAKRGWVLKTGEDHVTIKTLVNPCLHGTPQTAETFRLAIAEVVKELGITKEQV